MMRAGYTPNDGLLAELHAAKLRALRRATVYLWTQLQRTLNVPNTGTSVRLRSGRRVTRYLDPSKPGEPPRKRTGWLQRNVAYEIDSEKLTVKIGCTANAPYGLYLELGTSRMAPRPWLLVTAQKHARQIEQIVGEEFANG